MINYYYELRPDVTIFGKQVKYIGEFNVHPEKDITPKFHDQAREHSTRWWIENDNGVTELSRTSASYIQWEEKSCNPKEFTWIKLQCYNIRDM